MNCNRYIQAVLLPWGIFLLMACGSTEGMKQRGEAGAPSCSFTLGSRTISWQKRVNDSALGLEMRVGNTNLPLKFDVYTVNAEDLDAFLKAVKASNGDVGPMALPLPGNPECPLFNVAVAGTMSEDLARKFPELISLKGLSLVNRTAALRLDYDGQKMEAEITWNGQVYYLSPWPGKNGVYYLLYKKEDAGFEKPPFHPY